MSFFDSISHYFQSILIIILSYSLTILIYHFYVKSTRNKCKSKHPFKNTFLLVASILPACLIVAFRNIDTGADTRNIWEGYMECLGRSFIQQITMDFSEFLYDVLRWTICRITGGNVQIFFFVMAFLTLLFIVLAINKCGLYHKELALFAFLMLFGPNLMNQSRQLISVAIMFYGFSCLYSNDIKQFFFWSIIASLIHISSVVGFIAYAVIYLLNKKDKTNYGFIIFLLVLSLSARFIIMLAGRIVIFDKYSKYFENTEVFEIGLGLLLLAIPTVIPTIISKKEISDSGIRNTVYLSIPTRVFGYYSYFLYRIAYYFSVITTIAVPLACDRAKGGRRVMIKTIFIVTIITYFILFYCWKDANVYFPYKPFWSN